MNKNKIATDKASLFDTISTCFAHIALQERNMSALKRRADPPRARLERYEPKKAVPAAPEFLNPER